MWLKICGMTSEEAVRAAVEAGVDAIGFVLATSVREVSVTRAAELAGPARGRVACIAVTLCPSQARIDEIVRVLAPDALQADLEAFTALRLPTTLERLPVLRSGASVPAVPPDPLLYEGSRSGAGERADWVQAARLARQSRLVLAGGLSVQNIAAAVAAVRPWGVDVSSAVESTPGVKSAGKIYDFARAARAVFGHFDNGNGHGSAQR